MAKIKILGLMINDRIKEAGRTQQTLSKYAHIIKARMGFHEVTPDTCSRLGVMIIQLTGDEVKWLELERELKQIRGLEIRDMNFDF